MADFKLASANAKTAWSKKYLKEYVRKSGFMSYMGSADNSIIRVSEELVREAGDTIKIPYFGALKGAGVTGSTALMGNEEALTNYATAIRAQLVRNGVKVKESETFKTDLDVANVARGSLVDWSASLLRTDIINALQSVIVKGAADGNGSFVEDTYVNYSTATATQRNDYLTNNSDRILFGDKKSNNTGVFSTSLSAITGAMKMTAATVTLAKRMAKQTQNFKINPYISDISNGKEQFVLFVGPEGFRDLENDPTIIAANTNARTRGIEDNPLFQSGDLFYAGVFIREIPEIARMVGVGAGGTVDVSTAFLCGANALAVAFSKRPEPRVQSWDYGMESNCGIVEIRGQAKMSAAGVQTGLVPVYHAASPDA